jgi:hypothetical protein
MVLFGPMAADKIPDDAKMASRSGDLWSLQHPQTIVLVSSCTMQLRPRALRTRPMASSRGYLLCTCHSSLNCKLMDAVFRHYHILKDSTQPRSSPPLTSFLLLLLCLRRNCWWNNGIRAGRASLDYPTAADECVVRSAL